MIGIIVAMQSEMELLREQLTNTNEERHGFATFTLGQISSRDVVVAQSGIGKVNSALTAREMIANYSPEVIINTGVAGGLDSTLCIGDIVVASQTTYNDAWCGEGNEWGQIQGLPTRFNADKRVHDCALLLANTLPIRSGLICSGDRFITSYEELQSIKERLPEAVATDMESNSIAQTCHLYQTPFMALRIISDTPGIKDHGKQYDNFWGVAPKQTFAAVSRLISML